MEIRARYVRVGVLTLAVLFAGFVFVYWLNNAAAFGNRDVYHVRFEGSVSGLARGSVVLFNGIRVGEVTRLDLSPSEPGHVLAIIAVDRATPIRSDTAAGIDFQGLTGSPVIALTGGKARDPLPAAEGRIPLLIADAGATQSMSQAARDVLRRLDSVLAENAEPLRKMIGNLDTFSGALARNSERLDGIVAGLERMTGGPAAKNRVVSYDLTVPRAPEAGDKPSSAQLVVPDPTALGVLDSERIQTSLANGAFASLPDVQWSDALPKLLQVKLLRSLEDAGRFAGVSRPLDGLTSELQLLVDVRKFQIGPNLAAEVELGGKILGKNGRIVAMRVFRAAVTAESAVAPAAVAALDQAFGQVGSELVSWAGHAATEPAAPRAAVPRRPSGG